MIIVSVGKGQVILSLTADDCVTIAHALRVAVRNWESEVPEKATYSQIETMQSMFDLLAVQGCEAEYKRAEADVSTQ